jgi:DNA-directed RNA polymerase specialized sigma24 family protein
VSAARNRSAEDVIQIIDQLPEREAAKLAQHLIGRMSSGDLADLLRAIALRVETGRDRNEGSSL